MTFVLLVTSLVFCILSLIVGVYVKCEFLQHRNVKQAVWTSNIWLFNIAVILLVVAMLFIICDSEKVNQHADVKATTNSQIISSISDDDLEVTHIGEYEWVLEQLTFGTVIPGN